MNGAIAYTSRLPRICSPFDPNNPRFVLLSAGFTPSLRVYTRPLINDLDNLEAKYAPHGGATIVDVGNKYISPIFWSFALKFLSSTVSQRSYTSRVLPKSHDLYDRPISRLLGAT